MIGMRVPFLFAIDQYCTVDFIVIKTSTCTASRQATSMQVSSVYILSVSRRGCTDLYTRVREQFNRRLWLPRPNKCLNTVTGSSSLKLGLGL